MLAKSEVSARPISIQLDAEDLLIISKWDADIRVGLVSSEAKRQYLESIMRRSGVTGELRLGRDGRSLLVFVPQPNIEASQSEELAKPA